MKKTLVLLLVLSVSTTFGQSFTSKGITGETNWMNRWTNFTPSTTDYREPNKILAGKITSNLTLSKKETYLLVGTVYITNQAILTIEPGTIIRGDKETCGTLVVTKGAKIIANGDQFDPIVFTSNSGQKERRPGDWGGIIVLGDAPINKIGGINHLDFNLDNEISQYGGTNTESNSGILKYVRIEYSGRKINASKELNGLSLAGVGKKTKIENVQISFSNDDSFECYGGEVQMDHLVSYRATDDDFDFTQGAQSTLFNCIAIRDPFSSDISGSRCFEIDSYDKAQNADFTKKMTKVTASNITMVNTKDNDQGLVREAIHVFENSQLLLSNAIVSNFSSVMVLDGKIKNTTAELSKIKLQNVLINRCKANFISENTIYASDVQNWFTYNAWDLSFSELSNSMLFQETSAKDQLDFRLRANTNVANR